MFGRRKQKIETANPDLFRLVEFPNMDGFRIKESKVQYMAKGGMIVVAASNITRVLLLTPTAKVYANPDLRLDLDIAERLLGQ